MRVDYSGFFAAAMGKDITPYPYQLALANSPWPDALKVETGIGKTAAVILAWIYKRLLNDPHTPRRLVYCLPMRVLVEQTAQTAHIWIKNLKDKGLFPGDRPLPVYTLMGGKIDSDWDFYPEQESILVGTQDQLLSRALNRGYAESRFRWPVQFGLLNNDCLWVMDEVQLMGEGLATTAQLDAFRRAFGTISPVHSLWMSATFSRDWLKTIDFSSYAADLTEIGLTAEDKKHPLARKRFEAKKPIEKVDLPGEKLGKIAEMILDSHQKGTRTLAVFNTVRRAVEAFKSLKDKKPKSSLILIHSRFRPEDRQKALERLLSPPDGGGTICISTQVVEAGVDVSAKTLFTDLAPWPSMVQRFGRCNREGLDSSARIFWFSFDLDKKGASHPYREKDLRNSLKILGGLKDAGPVNLPPVDLPADYKHVFRAKDVIEIFDTTPDLAGLDIDISRFIRESDDQDIQVFWRDFPLGGPGESEPAPSRNEVCSVPIFDLKGRNKWRWDHLEKVWARQGVVSPGMLLMLRSAEGGYSGELGWTGDENDIPEALATSEQAEEGNDDDTYLTSGWQTIAEHTDLIVKELRTLLALCPLSRKDLEEILLLAARWHDAGKAHEVFQRAISEGAPGSDGFKTWAKTDRRTIHYERKGFRHELASALALLGNGFPDLAAYLAAAHHGKVRLSIRSLPEESTPNDPEVRFARGIWEGDVLKEADLGGSTKLPETMLDLSYMELGEGSRGPSWLARMISLRDDISLGPFRLAYLEALLRVSDWRASQKMVKE